MFWANPSEAVVRKQVDSVQFGYVVVGPRNDDDNSQVDLLSTRPYTHTLSLFDRLIHSFIRSFPLLLSSCFSFYTDQEVRDRSVVEITCPTAFDPNQTPLPGGLYDPRMGPIHGTTAASAMHGSCVTCALPPITCSGHFGHVELAVPVYHPLLIPELVSILRTKCLACHKLKAATPQLLLAQAKFGLLWTERFAELVELENVVATKMQQARQQHAQQEQEGGGGSSSSSAHKHKSKAAAQKAMEDHLRMIIQETQQQQQQASNNNWHKKHPSSSSSYYKQQRKLLRQETLAMLKSCPKCNHCGAMPPKIRHDSYNKIFRAALSKKHSRINQAEGIVFRSALDEEYSDTNRMAAATTATNESAGTATTSRRRTTSTDYDSEDTDREEEDLMDVVDDEAIEDNNDSDNQNGDDESEEEDDSDDGAVARKGKNGKTQQQQRRDKYLHPGEVQAQLKRTWELETFLCNCLFGSSDDSSEYATRKDGYQLFFMQAIPVPPSRFRPPMHLGVMVVEHSQTQSLSKIIQLNEAIRRHFCQPGHESRAYTAWIDLQTEVNCFMDASKNPGATAASALSNGIKQILERKEGLFRKNMMGKRVDYACRSVISPDPYLGTNEIGLPHYFATVLTYPTPVTDLNSKEMRQLVERGPDNYPGARWVEINGRRVDLSKMNQHRRQAVAAQLLTHMKRGGMPAIVGRQLRDGDYVLMNRQVSVVSIVCILILLLLLSIGLRIGYNPRVQGRNTNVMHHAEEEMMDYDLSSGD